MKKVNVKLFEKRKKFKIKFWRTFCGYVEPTPQFIISKPQQIQRFIFRGQNYFLRFCCDISKFTIFVSNFFYFEIPNHIPFIKYFLPYRKMGGFLVFYDAIFFYSFGQCPKDSVFQTDKSDTLRYRNHGTG